LIKVEAAPINPSDIYMMQGEYNGTFEYPLIPGSEGAGTVIESGGGFMTWGMVGKRVGFTRQMEAGGRFSIGGSYAEYCVTNAYQCTTLDNNTSFEHGSSAFVNPVTAIGLLERCKANGASKHKGVIQTGGASQLGKMMI
jgi:NADPH:quinone reductase